jgi:hypothetical protein
LKWEYPDSLADPLGEFFDRIGSRILEKSLRTIDSGGTVEGDGWELSRQGLQTGDAFEILPFHEVAAAEHHDGQLQVWKVGDVEPFFKIAEGSKNEPILQAILNRRKSNRVAIDPGTLSGEGLGRMLFERRNTAGARVVAWLLALFFCAMILIPVAVLISSGYSILFGLGAFLLIVVIFLLPISTQLYRLRFHERGLARSGLWGIRQLPFEDLAEVKSTLMSYETQLKLVFKPVKGRGLKQIALVLPATDPALETVRTYIATEKFAPTQSA